MGGVLTTIMLISIFVFFILFYRGRISKFLKWFDNKGVGELRLVTKESKEMIQNYLLEMVLVILINATLTATRLWAIRITYALLLGVFSAYFKQQIRCQLICIYSCFADHGLVLGINRDGNSRPSYGCLNNSY